MSVLLPSAFCAVEGPEEVASDSAEAVNAYPDGHLSLPFLP